MNIVALIPARAGSKRIPGKNIKPLGGKPLIQWTIEAAQQSGVFSRIVVSSDDDAILKLADSFMKPPTSWTLHCRRPEHASDDSPDIQWVRDILPTATEQAFAILRPTSPFRTADTIRRAYAMFITEGVDSIRAVEPCGAYHPAKMWIHHTGTNWLLPVMSGEIDDVPLHSLPTQRLPRIYRQNASLEMAWTSVLSDKGTISGDRIAPFFTDGWEGYDINTPEDWERAEAHAQTLLARV